jgi:uncharacterized membrane protein YeaQ/YmgE (transglycosylase-associated protein family)
MDAGMGLISWVVFGLIAGLIAKLIMPGRDPGGCIITVIVGIVGALLGGFIATAMGFGGISGFDWRSLLIAVLGSLVLLFIWRAISGRRV